MESFKVKQTISCGTGNRGHDLSLHPCTNDDEEWPTTAPIPHKPPPPTPTPPPPPTNSKKSHATFVVCTYSMILVLGSNGEIELSPNLSITYDTRETNH